MDKKINKRDKVLSVAKEIFAAKGFAGTSIRDIANKAEVSLGVIYHHFTDKENLWHQVKKCVVETPLEFGNNLDEFLECIITSRYKMYQTHPEAVRMVWWQMLEGQVGMSSDKLIGSHLLSPVTWVQPIKLLQANKAMRDDVGPNHVIDYIAQSSIAIFYSPSKERQTDEKRDEYFKFIMDCLKISLAYRPAQA